MSLLWHPWLTTTNLSYRFPILKLPPPPYWYIELVYHSLRNRNESTIPTDRLGFQLIGWDAQLFGYPSAHHCTLYNTATYPNYPERKLLLIFVNFTPKTSHSCLKTRGTLRFPDSTLFMPEFHTTSHHWLTTSAENRLYSTGFLFKRSRLAYVSLHRRRNESHRTRPRCPVPFQRTRHHMKQMTIWGRILAQFSQFHRDIFSKFHGL